jgi:hypothetical protein
MLVYCSSKIRSRSSLGFSFSNFSKSSQMFMLEKYSISCASFKMSIIFPYLVNRYNLCSSNKINNDYEWEISFWFVNYVKKKLSFQMRNKMLKFWRPLKYYDCKILDFLRTHYFPIYYDIWLEFQVRYQ